MKKSTCFLIVCVAVVATACVVFFAARHRYLSAFQHVEGEWKDTVGSVYQGQLLNGLPDGVGVMHYSDGDWYEGSFSRGIIQGHGIYHRSSGNTMECNFIDACPNGKAIVYIDSTKTDEIRVYDMGRRVK